MRKIFFAFAGIVCAMALPLTSCSDDPPDPAAQAVLAEQASCRTTLTKNPGTRDAFDIFVDVIDSQTYIVTVESGEKGWKVLPGSLEDALLAAYREGRRAGLSVRIVYGSSLRDSLVENGAVVTPQAMLEAKQTYYATHSVGCTDDQHEAGAALPDPTANNCIPRTANGCRIKLTDACVTGGITTDAGPETFLDIAFGSWTRAKNSAGETSQCYGVKAGGPYAVALPALSYCKCSLDEAALRGQYEDARLLIETTLEFRNMDRALARAITAGITAAALSKLDDTK